MEIIVKLLLIIVLLLGSSLLPVQQPSQNDPIAGAETAYHQGNYPEAIRQYENLVGEGIHDGALYFDLASAYYQSGDLGRALLNFRRAQQFFPRDSVLNDTMALIRARRVDIQPDEAGILADVAALTVGFVTIYELVGLLSIVWAAGCLLLAFHVIKPRLRNRLRIPMLVCALLFMIGLILLGGRLWLGVVRPPAVIVADKVSAMSGPGDQYLDLFDLHSAAEMRIVQTREKWVWVELPDGRQGWIPASSLNRVSQ